VSALPPAELLESGPEPVRLRSRWAALPRSGRVLVVSLVVVLLLGAGLGWLRERSAERELARRISLTTSLEISSSSTTPPGGEVGYFVVVHNRGPRRVSVTAVAGETGRLRLGMRDDAARPLDPGTGTAIALSVRLSCLPGAAETSLPVEIRLRREDGGSATRRVDLRPTAPLLDVVSTLCAVRPDLRDHEISGPVLRVPEPTAGSPN